MLTSIPPTPPVAVDDRIEAAARDGAWFAFSLSGGKDSAAASFAAAAWLDTIGHPRDRRLGIHADLGRAEWQSTPATVEATAERLGLPLLVVRRRAGDMVARWEQRFANGKARFEALSTYGLIGPWSSAALRFCSGELKAQVIGPELARRFRGATIVSVIGIRRDESRSRSTTPVSMIDTRFAATNNTSGTRMLTWHPAVEWTTPEVFACHAANSLPLHEAYTVYHSSRLSCAYCVLASLANLRAAAEAAENLPLFLHLVAIEATSTFSFQPARWLAEVAPHLLPPALATDVARAKLDAADRRRLEASMPPTLRYSAGWPPRLPTLAEGHAIATARRPILDRHGLADRFPDATSVVHRFAELLDEQSARAARKR